MLDDDSKIIIILGLCVMLVMALDDRVGERWCKTYDWCPEEAVK